MVVHCVLHDLNHREDEHCPACIPEQAAQERYIRHKRLEDARERVVGAAKARQKRFTVWTPRELDEAEDRELDAAVQALIELENQS